MLKYQYIFWDWNGTLVNDVYAALASVNDILAKRKRPAIDLPRYYSLMGTPITRFYERLFAPEKPDFPLLAAEFHEGYDRHMDQYGLMPGARNILLALRERGACQIVVSSSEKRRLNEQISRFQLNDIFSAVLGQEDFQCSSKLESARRYMQTYSCSPSRSVMIGDLEHDFEVASALGMDCFLIAQGHQSYDSLQTLGVPVLHDISELKKHLF
ncbi:MAG: HAD family hydrolase [Ruminococcaceae bacterium]|nr:HAD family hydrolase [Oscillospiraceae bacterium]